MFAVPVIVAALFAAPAGAQTPTAPANGAQIEESDVVLRWTLAPNWRAECVEWAARPETSYDGGPFLDPKGSECLDIGPQDVAYLLENLDVYRYYWHVKAYTEVCDPNTFECEQQSTWGPTAYFDSVEPPPPPPPNRCTDEAAEYMAHDRLLPYAKEHYRRYYRGIEDDWWGVTRFCRDLDRDGDREMIVYLQCCTGGSISPWAIFKHDEAGQWRMRFASVKKTVFRIRFRGRTVRAMMPAPYEGACTRFVRYREVRWRGQRFHAKVTKRQRVRNPC